MMPNTKNIIALLIAGVFMASPAFADKPEWAGGGKGNMAQHKSSDNGHSRPGKGKDKDKHNQRDRDSSVRVHFNDQQRVYLHDYYRDEFRSGRCPPGLAKKDNGCMPPGQAKKWRIGYPLRSVTYYELPPAIIVHIGAAPAGYKYVRVASDILMIAAGTGLVVDAISDLSSM